MLQLLAMKVPNVLTFDFMSKPSPGEWSRWGGGHTEGDLHGLHTAGLLALSFFMIIYLLFLTVLDLCCCTGFSLVAARRGYPLAAVTGFLIAVASLVAEHSL